MQPATPAQQKLIDDHSAWVGRVAAVWARRRGLLHEYEMFHNAALFGLEQAARRYDPKHGTRFTTYCLLRITGEMGDCARRSDDMSRIMRRARQVDHAPGVVTSINALDLEDRRALLNTLAIEVDDTHERAVDALEMIPPGRERKVMEWYYIDGMLMKEIAERLGCSEVRIGQIHAQAIESLRRAARRESA